MLTKLPNGHFDNTQTSDYIIDYAGAKFSFIKEPGVPLRLRTLQEMLRAGRSAEPIGTRLSAILIHRDLYSELAQDIMANGYQYVAGPITHIQIDYDVIMIGIYPEADPERINVITALFNRL